MASKAVAPYSDTDILSESDSCAEGRKAIKIKKPRKITARKTAPPKFPGKLPADSSDSEASDNEPVKAPRKKAVKRAAPQKATKAKKKKTDSSDLIKQLLCDWTNEPDCVTRLLDGKKVAFVPVFI